MGLRSPPRRGARQGLGILNPAGGPPARALRARVRPARLRTLHDLATALARRPEVVEFAGELVRGRGSGRLARLAAAFSFVSQLAGVEPPEEPRDGVDALVALAGEDEGPAVILAALLRALGERVSLCRRRDRTWVEVAVDFEDVARLPPFARLRHAGAGFHIPLDARGRALGWLADDTI